VLELEPETALGTILRRRGGESCGNFVGQSLDTGRVEFEGGEDTGEGDLQILDRVAHLIPLVLRDLKIQCSATESSVKPVAGRPRSDRREDEVKTVTRAARWRAKRAKRAIRALQIAGVWPV